MIHTGTKLSDKRQVSGGDLPKDYKITDFPVEIDFEGIPTSTLRELAFATLWIVAQRYLRTLKPKELEAMKTTGGYKRKWSDISGGKGKTVVVDMKASLKLLGWSDEQIELVLANKDLAVKLFEEMQKRVNVEEATNVEDNE